MSEKSKFCSTLYSQKKIFIIDLYSSLDHAWVVYASKEEIEALLESLAESVPEEKALKAAIELVIHRN